MKYEAVIFDLDGVVCSTDHYHYLAWKALADDLGVPFDEGKNDRLRGVSRMASLEIVLEEYRSPALTAGDKERLAAHAGGFDSAGIGPAAGCGLATYAMEKIQELVGICAQ